jgi:hypothetical protein
LAVVLEDRCADAARVDLSANDRHLALRDRHLEAEGRAVILRDHFRSLAAEMLQHMNEFKRVLLNDSTALVYRHHRIRHVRWKWAATCSSHGR